MSDYNDVAGGPAPPIRQRTWDIFISYAREDAVIARSLAVAIESRGLTIWLDTKLKAGEPLQAINQALRSSGAVIVLLSTASLSSRWLRREVDAALHALPRDCVFPIAVGKVDVQNLPSWLVDRQWLHLRDRSYVDKVVDQLLPALEVALGGRESETESIGVVDQLPPRVPLVGVNNYLRELRAKRTGVTWIVGMAGMGKTALAREYAFQVRDEVDSIWWLSGLDSDLLEIGRKLRSTEDQSKTADRKPGLVVVDELDTVSGDLGSLVTYLETLGRSHRILITTRRVVDSRLMRENNFTVLAIGPLSQAAIADYLDSISPKLPERERAELTRITQSIGSSPLLLRLVAQVLQQRLTDDLLLATSASEVAIDRVLHVLLKQLSEDERYRLDVLSFCSGILTTVRVNTRWSLPGDDILFDRLLQWGLCIEQGDRTLFAHQVVLDFLRKNAPRKALEDAVAYMAPRLPDPSNAGAKELMTSVVGLTEFSEVDWDRVMAANLAELLIWQASVWRAAGEPERAELLCPRALMLAADSEQTLLRIRTMNLQSALAFDRGRIAEASAIERQTASLALAELGPDHPMSIASLANLATSLRAQGDLPEAITLLRQVVEQSRARLPIGHPDLIDAQTNLAICLREAGLFEEAMAHLQEAISDTTDDRSRLQMDQVLAALLTDLGRLDEASAVLTECLARADSSHNSGRSDLLMARANLAMVYARQGRLNDALSIQSKVVDRFEVTYGPDHPSALSARSNYAMLLAVAGSSSMALQLFVEVAASRARILDSDHPDTLQSWMLAGRTARDCGAHARALDIYSNLLGDVVRVLGPDHAMSFTVREEIAQELTQTGNTSEGRLAYRELLADLERVMSPDHPMLARVRAQVSRYV
jgi:tetratricopeptide (TPR) repeat protein